MKLRNKKTGEVIDAGCRTTLNGNFWITCNGGGKPIYMNFYESLADLNKEWEDYKPAEPLIKDEKIRKAVRAWAEAENCTREMNLYYTLNRQEKYITFHNPQTGSELQLCDFDSPVFQEIREYTIAELCGEEEE